MPSHVEKTFPRRPSRFASGFYLLMTLLIAGSLMGLIHMTLLEQWYGEGELARAGVSLPAVWANREIVLLGDFHCDNQPPSPERGQWESLLKRHGIPFSVTSQFPTGTNGLVILPSAECLSLSDREALRDWVRAGGGVVATAWPGLRNSDGREIGSEFAAEVFGLQLRRATIREPFCVTLANEFPLGVGIAPGQSWQIDSSYAIHGRGALSAGYWSGTRLTTSDDTATDRIAITYRRFARGRVVWFGASLHAVSLQSLSRTAWERLFLNGLHWAGRRILAGASYWPSGYPAAAVIAGEVRSPSDVTTAAKAAVEFGAIGLPSTLFINAALFDKMRMDQLDQRTEVALSLDGGSATGTSFGQFDWFRERTGRAAGKRATGVRARGRVFSQVEWEHLARHGFRYQVTSASPERSAPEILHTRQSALFPLDQKSFVLLPETARNDLAVLSQHAGPEGSTTHITDFLKQDFLTVGRRNGLYVLNYRMDLLGSDQIRPAMLAFATHLRDQGVWVATAADVAEWWIAHEKIEVYAERVSQRRIRITVRNTGDNEMRNLAILVGLPHAPSGVRLSSTVFWAQPASLHLDRDSERLQLDLSRIRPQSTSTWLVDLY